MVYDQDLQPVTVTGWNAIDGDRASYEITIKRNGRRALTLDPNEAEALAYELQTLALKHKGIIK